MCESVVRNKNLSDGLSPSGNRTANYRAPSFFGGGLMSDQLYRAEHYRDLAEECRRLGVTSFSARMRNRYWRIAENYRMLAEAEERGLTSLRWISGASTALT